MPFQMFGSTGENELRRANRAIEAAGVTVGQNRINRAQEMFGVMGPRMIRQAREAGGVRGMSSSSVAKQMVSDAEMQKRHKAGELSDAQTIQSANMYAFAKKKKAEHNAAAQREIGKILSGAGFALSLVAPGIGSALGSTVGGIATGLGQAAGLMGSSMGSGFGAPFMDIGAGVGNKIFGGSQSVSAGAGTGAIDPLTNLPVAGGAGSARKWNTKFGLSSLGAAGAGF